MIDFSLFFLVIMTYLITVIGFDSFCLISLIISLSLFFCIDSEPPCWYYLFIALKYYIVKKRKLTLGSSLCTYINRFYMFGVRVCVCVKPITCLSHFLKERYYSDVNSHTCGSWLSSLGKAVIFTSDAWVWSSPAGSQEGKMDVWWGEQDKTGTHSTEWT